MPYLSSTLHGPSCTDGILDCLLVALDSCLTDHWAIQHSLWLHVREGGREGGEVEGERESGEERRWRERGRGGGGREGEWGEGEVEGGKGGEVEVGGGEGKRGGVEKGGRKNEMHNRHSTHTHTASQDTFQRIPNLDL